MARIDSATTMVNPARTSSITTPNGVRFASTRPRIEADMIALTPAGRASLEQELCQLRDDRLPALIGQLVEARDDPATRDDGADVLTVQQEQHRVQRRVDELDWLLAVARDVAPTVDGVIALGSSVEIADDGERDTFQLVDPREANVAEGRVSVVSPIGQALLGHTAGDEVVVEAPAGERRLHVVAVS